MWAAAAFWAVPERDVAFWRCPICPYVADWTAWGLNPARDQRQSPIGDSRWSATRRAASKPRPERHPQSGQQPPCLRPQRAGGPRADRLGRRALLGVWNDGRRAGQVRRLPAGASVSHRGPARQIGESDRACHSSQSRHHPARPRRGGWRPDNVGYQNHHRPGSQFDQPGRRRTAGWGSGVHFGRSRSAAIWS